MVGILAGGLGAGSPTADGRVGPVQRVGDAGLVEGLELALALLFEEERLVELRGLDVTLSQLDPVHCPGFLVLCPSRT